MSMTQKSKRDEQYYDLLNCGGSRLLSSSFEFSVNNTLECFIIGFYLVLFFKSVNHHYYYK